jgi:short-subunit dehydrogenase
MDLLGALGILVRVVETGSFSAPVAPAFVARGASTIINISSVVGIAVEALNGVYSASKSAYPSFSRGAVVASILVSQFEAF